MIKKIIFTVVTLVIFSYNIEHIKADVTIDYTDSINKNIVSKESSYLPDSTKIEDTHYKLTTNGKIAYCSEGNKQNPSGKSTWSNCQTLTGTKGLSLAYIFENGYKEHKEEYSSSDYLVGNDKYHDYFITQLAVWEYTVSASWQKNFDYSAQTYKNEKNDTTIKISNLVNDAKKAQSGANLDIIASDTSMSLTSDGKYYISNEIKISGKYLNDKISTSIEGEKDAFTTKNKDSSEGETSFENNSTIYIKVPVESFEKETEIKLTIKSTTALGEDKVQECTYTGASAANYQKIIIYTPSNKELTKSITLSASKNPVKISKADITNNKEIEGAKLTIKNSNGTIISSWISEKTPKLIYLGPGNYTLEETIAPDGYIKSTSKIEFTISDEGKVQINGKEVSEIVITNEPIIVKISKRSITGSEELKGAKLKITDKDGTIAEDISGNKLEWTSTDKTKEFQLKVGDYILSEEIAPEGYELSETIIKFTVTSDGKILVDEKDIKDNLIIFKNTPEPKQVPTGNAIIYIAGTMCLVALGMSIYIIVKRKKI